MNLPTLSPAASIQALSIFSAFCIRVTAGFAICLIIARLATSAAYRFAIWLSFLLVSALYWLDCVANMVFPAIRAAAAEGAAPSSHQLSPVILSNRIVSYVGPGLSIAGIIYCTVLALAASMALCNILRLVRVLRYRTPASASLHEALGLIRAQISGPDCSIWLLPGLVSPASLGCVKPGIYLPLDEAESAIEMPDILCHEYAHLRRRDGFWEILASASRWILCFHPFAHKALASMRLERELACDSLVMQQASAQRASYADTLLRFGWKATLADDSDYVGIGFTSQAAVLNARVALILAGERAYSKWSRALRLLVTSGACWAFVAVVPALWVVFMLPPVALQRLESAAISLPAAKQLHRKVISNPIRRDDQLSAPPVSSADLSTAALFPEVIVSKSAVERHPAYHIQNVDEPMSNPVVLTPLEAEEQPTAIGRRPSSARQRANSTFQLPMPSTGMSGSGQSVGGGGSGDAGGGGGQAHGHGHD